MFKHTCTSRWSSSRAQFTHTESRLHSESCSTAVQWSWSCFIFSIACVKPASPFLISQRIPNAVIPSLHRLTGWFTEERASLLLLPLGANYFCHFVYIIWTRTTLVIECMDLQVMFHTLDLKNECSVEPFTRNMFVIYRRPKRTRQRWPCGKWVVAWARLSLSQRKVVLWWKNANPFYNLAKPLHWATMIQT